jgi:hypothetical protein
MELQRQLQKLGLIELYSNTLVILARANELFPYEKAEAFVHGAGGELIPFDAKGSKLIDSLINNLNTPFGQIQNFAQVNQEVLMPLAFISKRVLTYGLFIVAKSKFSNQRNYRIRKNQKVLNKIEQKKASLNKRGQIINLLIKSGYILIIASIIALMLMDTKLGKMIVLQLFAILRSIQVCIQTLMDSVFSLIYYILNYVVEQLNILEEGSKGPGPEGVGVEFPGPNPIPEPVPMPCPEPGPVPMPWPAGPYGFG